MREKNLELAVELRHKLHKYPELSNEEKETKKTLMMFLKDNTTLEIVDRGKWFYAAYCAKEPKGRIAFRADFDAIKVFEETPLEYCSVNKGVAHKCGHDGHSAALAAFALEINENGADKDIYFIFQFGEETGDGGEPCAELISEKAIDEVYAAHNFPGGEFGSMGIRKGTICCASKGMEIVFTGASAHASQPEDGKNPALAISKTVLELEKIADPKKYNGLVLATVVQIDLGERAFGVAAHKGKLLMTIRGQHESEMDLLQEQIETFAKEKAEEYGLKIEFLYYDEFPETFNHPESVDKIINIAKEKNWSINLMENPIRSSEDFGHYLKKAPGALVWIGAGENWPPIHSEDFDFNDKLIPRIVEFFQALI